MDALVIKRIETAIQYEFKNKKLLEEAFLVSPEPDNDAYSSEVFRIPGKRSINSALVYMILSKYGQLDEEGYRVTTNKDSVNYIIDNLYTRDVYARNIQVLGLAEYLQIPDEESYDDMSRRLFESLVGAITIDCNWNFDIITEVVKFLLDADYYLKYGFEDFEHHYVAKIYNWCVENNKTLPQYRFAMENGVPACAIRFGKDIIIGKSKSKTMAKFEAAKKVYEKLLYAGYIQERDEDGYIIGELPMLPSECIQYLEESEKNDEIGKVSYEFVSQDSEFFFCICTIDGEDFSTEAPGDTEEEAKANAAYKMVKYLKGYKVTNDYE